MTRIAIIGGGIAGLATALSLAAAGCYARVYEAVDNLKPLGVGINLLPHAVRELAELGMLDELSRIGIAIDRLDYIMADGRPVWNEPRGISAGYHWPQIAIHRGKFQLFLRDEVIRVLGPDAIVTGHQLMNFVQGEDSVSLNFANGAFVQAGLAIGADGIHSAMRRQLYPDEGRPIWNGVSLFRSTTWLPASGFANAMLWVGHSRQKFIAYPIARDGNRILINWVCDLQTGEPGSEPTEDWNRIVEKGHLLSRYRGWQWDGIDIPAIIAGSDAVYEFPMVDRDPLERWSFDRVTLVGDAAHPMYPVGSNGATQAIIDARVLAHRLASTPDPVTALRSYEQARLGATSAIVLGNRAGGPDRALELARERAPDPSTDLDRVFPLEERAGIAADYKKLAGFDPEILNARESFSVAG